MCHYIMCYMIYIVDMLAYITYSFSISFFCNIPQVQSSISFIIVLLITHSLTKAEQQREHRERINCITTKTVCYQSNIGQAKNKKKFADNYKV